MIKPGGIGGYTNTRKRLWKNALAAAWVKWNFGTLYTLSFNKGSPSDRSPKTGDAEPRVMARIEVEAHGERIYFASTHLDHLGVEDNRVLQANALNELVSTFDKPLIIGGDFNALPDSQTITVLQETLTSGCLGTCPLTFPAANPNRTIDYVFFWPANRFSSKSYQALPDHVSDHLAVLTVLEIR